MSDIVLNVYELLLIKNDGTKIQSIFGLNFFHNDFTFVASGFKISLLVNTTSVASYNFALLFF